MKLVKLVIKLGVLDFQMGLLNKGRDFFELVIGIIRVMQHDSVKYFGQVAVQVLLDGAASVLGSSRLVLNALKSFSIHCTHLCFIMERL